MERAREILDGRISYATDPYAAAEGADALLILTEWKEFANLDLVRIKRLLRSPLCWTDEMCSPKQKCGAGLTYHSIGRRRWRYPPACSRRPECKIRAVT